MASEAKQSILCATKWQAKPSSNVKHHKESKVTSFFKKK
jgi:hypothetical protein